MTTTRSSIFDPAIAGPALVDSVRKLDPRRMVRNPVMFVTEVGALLATFLFVEEPRRRNHRGERLRGADRRRGSGSR